METVTEEHFSAMTEIIKAEVSYNNWLLQLREPSLRKKLGTEGKRKSVKGQSSDITTLISVTLEEDVLFLLRKTFLLF